MKKRGLLISSTILGFFVVSCHYYVVAAASAPAQTLGTGFLDLDTEAVVIEAARDDHQRNSATSRKGKHFYSFYYPLYADSYVVPGVDDDNNEVVVPSLVVSPSPNIDTSCTTNQGKAGRCESFEKCFPLLNLPEDMFGNETSNYDNLQEELHQITANRKCSSVVHAGNSKFSNVCCDTPQEPDASSPIAQFYNIPNDDEDAALNGSVTPKITKIVNTWATCGEKQFDFKIIGGQESIPHEYPWMVSLWGKSSKAICGAALLDNDFVLTAAHCIAKYTSQDVSKIRLLIGDHNIRSKNDGHHEVRSVSKIIKHKRFSFQTFANDIALLKFDRPVPFTDRIRPICLPSGARRSEDDPHLVVAGWGQTTFKGTSSDVLMKVLVPGVSNESCGKVYNTISPVGITSEMLCAGGQGVDSCIGDSGGPLIQLVNNRYEQIGIVSFGRECGTYPGVYTKVHSFLKWITVNRNKY